MNKSLNSKTNRPALMGDRSFNLGAPTQRNNTMAPTLERHRALSTQRILRPLTYTKQIIIKTEEPDIPQITILKIERSVQNLYRKGLQFLEATLQRRKLKNLFLGFSHICHKIQQKRLLLINLKRLTTFIKNKQRQQNSAVWEKLINEKMRHKSKLNASRTISKFSIFIINKTKRNTFQKIKQYYLLAKKQQGKTATTQDNENLQLQINKLKSFQFSQKFISICKKHININNNFISNIEAQLQPILLNEIQKYQIMRNKKGFHINNQVILIVLNNQIITIKSLKKEIQSSTNNLKDIQQSNNQLSLYKKIQKQFEKNDNQIRVSFEKHKKIQEKQLTKLIENQIKIWNKYNDIPLYKSRIFISAIIVKLIKDGANPLNQFLDVLQNVISISSDAIKLQEFRGLLKGKQRTNNILVSIVGKLIEFANVRSIGMIPIIQRGISENQQLIMLQIKSMKDEIKDFIQKFNNPSEKQKLRKTFSSRRPKAPQQIRDLYVAFNQLITLIQNRDNKKDGKKQLGDKVDVIMKILLTFKQCLGQGNYIKWENFLNKLTNKDQFASLLSLLQQVNDILNDKIHKETSPLNSQLQAMKKSELKLKQQIEKLKNKNIETEKKLKNAEANKTKIQQNAKMTQILTDKEKLLQQLQGKLKQLNIKYVKLQRDSKKQVADLKQELQVMKNENGNRTAQKDSQIKLLKQRNNEKDNELEKILKQSNLLNGKIGSLQSTIQGLKLQMDRINRQMEQQRRNNQKSKSNNANIISEQQKIQLNKLIMSKDNHIAQIQNRISIILEQLKNSQSENQKLNALIMQKVMIIKKSQQKFRQREMLSNQSIQNKLDYIKKLEGIIQTNEMKINDLNLQINNLVNNDSPKVEDFKNQQRLLLIAQNQLRAKLQIIKQLQQKMKISQLQHGKHKVHWENEMRNMNARMGHFDSITNELRQKIDVIRNLQTQLRISSQNHQLDKQKWENQWKNNALKFDQISMDNLRLKNEIQQSNNLISQLKLQVSSKSNSSIYLNNILLLLTNTISNFIKCHPQSDTQVNAKTSQQIYNDLMGIKVKYSNIESDMFMNFESYVIKFVQNDIGKYRYELALRIEELVSLKERFLQFLNKQIEFSKNYLTYKYQYQGQQKQQSTSFKTIVETPIKFSEKAFNIGREVQQKTIHAQRLFDSYQK